MAVPVSPTSLLLLLTLLSSTPAALVAIRPSTGGGDDSPITKACNGTRSLTTPACAYALRSSTESPKRVAELAYLYLVKVGEELSKELDGAVAAAAGKGEATRNCLSTLQGNLKRFHGSVSRFSPDKFAEAKNNLDGLLRAPSDSGASCADEDIDKEHVVRKEYTYEDMLQLTLELMNKGGDGETKKSLDPEENKAAVDEFEEMENRKRKAEGAALVKDTADKDPLVKACAEVIAPTDVITCVAVFKDAAAKAVTAKANPRRLAVLAFRHLYNSGTELHSELSAAVALVKGEPGDLPHCLQAYEDRLIDILLTIQDLTPEESDAKFIEAYEKLRSARGTEDVAYHCTVKDLTDNSNLKKFGELEKALVFTIYLMGDAAPSSSPSKAPKA